MFYTRELVGGCRWWDEGGVAGGHWSDAGCAAAGLDRRANVSRCACDHLTDFLGTVDVLEGNAAIVVSYYREERGAAGPRETAATTRSRPSSPPCASAAGSSRLQPTSVH